MVSPFNPIMKVGLAIWLINLIHYGTCLSECEYNKTLIRGRIFEGKSMNTTLSFHQTNVRTIFGCHHVCLYNCRCSSLTYLKKNASDVDNCFLLNVSNINQYVFNDVSASVSYFEAKANFSECSPDCFSVLHSDRNPSNGIYELVSRKYESSVTTVCDMETDGGGWTLLQRRVDGSVDFSQDWSAYKNGFGDLKGEFWLGLDAAHELMKDGDMTLRFDLWDGEDYAYAEYHHATIASEMDNYRFSFMSYEGDAGDAMLRHNNSMFTTKDRDNDSRRGKNCAAHHSGAWWFASCHDANLNGNYGDSRFAMGITWKQWKTHTHSLSETEMKIKRNG